MLTHTDHPTRHYDRTCPACRALCTRAIDSDPSVHTAAARIDYSKVSQTVAIGGSVADGAMFGSALGMSRTATGVFPPGTVVKVNGVPHELLQPTPYYTATEPQRG